MVRGALIIDDVTVRAAYLSCLSVEPEAQRRGIGSRPVRGGLSHLANEGFAAATLLGDPAYYRQFGFCSGLAQAIVAPHRSRGAGFQAVELVPDVLSGKTVRGAFPPVIAPR